MDTRYCANNRCDVLQIRNFQQQQQQHQQQPQPQLQNDKPIDLTNSSESEPEQVVQFPNGENSDEVIKAAKSLFSKRTRTLYHWMYPNTPKFQLKTAVSQAWDTMGYDEKQFYISQVLGKFGYPQASLMVNPQLGGMQMPVVDAPDAANVETRTAVFNILKENCSSASYDHSRKRGRPRGTKRPNPDKMLKSKRQRYNREEDEFNDDPELRKELDHFQWTLHFVEN